MLEAMPRLSNPGRGEFAGYVRRRLPVVIEGAARGWPALTTWTFDRLRAVAGQVPVRVQSRHSGAALDFEYKDVTIEALIDSIERGGGRDYLGAFPLLDHVPSLRDGVEVPRYVGAPGGSPRVFIGPEGALSPLHYDLGHVISAQIMGTKRIIVAELGARDFMHPDLRGPGLLSALFDPEAPALPQTGIRPLRRWVADAQPGDLVFLPGRRHHFVRSLENTISVSFFWYPPSIRLVRRLMAMMGRAAF